MNSLSKRTVDSLQITDRPAFLRAGNAFNPGTLTELKRAATSHAGPSVQIASIQLTTHFSDYLVREPARNDYSSNPAIVASTGWSLLETFNVTTNEMTAQYQTTEGQVKSGSLAMEPAERALLDTFTDWFRR